MSSNVPIKYDNSHTYMWVMMVPWWSFEANKESPYFMTSVGQLSGGLSTSNHAINPTIASSVIFFVKEPLWMSPSKSDVSIFSNITIIFLHHKNVRMTRNYFFHNFPLPAFDTVSLGLTHELTKSNEHFFYFFFPTISHCPPLTS